MCAVQVRWVNAMPVCVLFVPSMSGIIFSLSAGAITDSQSVKYKDKDIHMIHPYFSQLYVEHQPSKASTL